MPKEKIKPTRVKRIVYRRPPTEPKQVSLQTYQPSMQVTQKGVVIGQTPADQTFFKSMRLLLDSDAITEHYRQHIWVYACISCIAINIAGVPFNIYTGKEMSPEPVQEGTREGEEGSLVYLFNHPNPQSSRYQLWEALMIFLGLDGECIFLLDRPAGRETDLTAIPKEIWALRATNFTPKVINNVFVGWEYTPPGSHTPLGLTKEQVIQFKYFNPYNPYRGQSPIGACAMGINQDWMASKYNLAFFKNSGDPGGTLIYKGDANQGNLSEPQKNAILSKWNDRHQGSDNAKRVALLEGNFEYKALDINHKDMDFLEQKKWNREEICSAYKLSKDDLGIFEDSNYANALIRDKVLWTKNLVPKMNYITDVLWTRLFRYINKGAEWGMFDYSKIEALQEDLAKKIEIAKGLYALNYTPNEINKRLGLGMPEDKSWRDEVYLPFSSVPASSLVGSTEEEVPPVPAKALPAPDKSVVVKMQGDDIDALLFSQDEWNRKLKSTTKPLYESIMTMAGQQISEELGGMFVFNLSDPKMIEFLSTKLNKVMAITETVRAQLKETLMEGVSLNETANELQDRIKTTFNFASNRSLTIARTEVAEASSGTRFIAMQEEGVDEHEWLSARDDHVRKPPTSKYNHAIDGEVVKVGEKFSNGLRYPSDVQGEAGNVCNCRCVAIVSLGKASVDRELYWNNFVEKVLDPNEKVFHSKIKAFFWKLRVAQLKLFAQASE